jgi:hypothetical protein
MAARGQCTFVWSAATNQWDKVADCDPQSGFHCAQDPTVLGVVGADDGDIWVSPCVVRRVSERKKRAKQKRRPKRA